MICCYNCNSNSGDLVLRIIVKNSDSNKNYVNCSSISRCVKDDSSSYHLFLLSNGINCCSSVNVSLNKIFRRSGIICGPLSSSNYVTCSLSYSTFADNYANSHNCICFWSGSALFEIKSCNVIRNMQGVLGTEGTVSTLGNVMVEDSCMLDNKANYYFYNVYSTTKYTLSNCTVDQTTSNQNLITPSTVTKSFILALNHMSTQNCHSKYDSVGTLTAILQTPSASKKPIICYTYGEMSQSAQNR
jgi:hypothetical protein